MCLDGNCTFTYLIGRYSKELENLIYEIFRGKAELCEFNGCCGSYLAVNYDGAVFLCDLFIGSESKKIGNILDMSLKQMLDRAETIIKISEKVGLNQECITCKYLEICKGGCLYRRLLLRNQSHDKDIYCKYRRNIIDHISLRLKSTFKTKKQAID
jgi:uncharacterized protein